MNCDARKNELIARIEAEFDEPICDVLDGFADMGYSACAVARVLDMSQKMLGRINESCKIDFTRREIAGVDKRRNIAGITYQCRTQTLSAWARELVIPVGTLWGRLYRHGMSVEEAFTRPLHARRVTGNEAVQRGRA